MANLLNVGPSAFGYILQEICFLQHNGLDNNTGDKDNNFLVLAPTDKFHQDVY
jgi:hypothetical protein